MMNIEQYLSAQKERVDQFLEKHIRDHHDCPTQLQKAMEYSLKAGGKRVRPILALASAQAVGGALEPVLPLACALEMIHTFSLIHDDLPCMDDDDLRRGQPTNHKIFGEGVAVLAGDGLLSEAFYLLGGAHTIHQVDPTILLDVIRDVALATGPAGMIGGQILDLEGEGAHLELEALEKIHRYKTGKLITVSVSSGAKIAGATPVQLETLRFYGEKVGLAFQIADDILNVEGDRQLVGKSVGSDKNNLKSTYPETLGLEASKKKAKTLVKEAQNFLKEFGTEADPLRELAQYIVLRRN